MRSTNGRQECRGGIRRALWDGRQGRCIRETGVSVRQGPSMSEEPLIDVRRLFRWFGSTHAVNDLTFEVHPGTVCGFIGPNGAGKTTSMRILATLDVPSAGDAFIDGFSVVNDPDYVRRRLGFMPDSFGSYSNINCREYLDFFARSYGISGEARNAAVANVMDFTGLNPLAKKQIKGLSKGMKQRLCLGRALIHDPKVLILDEPAAGLDPRARIELRDMIRQLATEQGKAVLISSHILTELAEVCDIVAIIEQGRLLTFGSVEEIQREIAGRRRVRVRVLNRQTELAGWLEEQMDLCEIERLKDCVSFHHQGVAEEEAAMLKAMIAAGFDVVAFGGEDESLENVFLRITQGLVQ